MCTAIVLAGLQYDQLPFISGGLNYSAHFTDAGGLVAGDDVSLAGVGVGTVTGVELDGQQVLVTFTVRDASPSATPPAPTSRPTPSSAASHSLCGVRRRRAAAGTTIPVERTNAPYSLPDASETSLRPCRNSTRRHQRLARCAVGCIAGHPSPEISGALEGMRRLSESINARDESLQELLGRAENVTGILAERSDRINELIVDANDLFGELSLRRDAITALITNVSSVSRQLTGLVQDNQAQMAPTLEVLNRVTANLQANKENIAEALDGLGPYISSLGESVASGPFFNAYVSNILPAPWWKAVVDGFVAPELLPQDLEDVIPDNPPSIKKDGE